MTLWIGKLSISTGITGRGDAGNGVSKFGFYYWSFIPHLHWNGGRLFRKEVVDVGWYFLCIHGSFTWWGNSHGNWGFTK